MEKSLKEAIQVSLNKDLGISYFDNVEGRLRDLLNNSPVMSTGWSEVDEKLGGGIARQELSLWCGASGTGKSIFLSNLSVNLVKKGYNVVYISLELADRVVSKRFDSMTTGIAQSDILSNINKVVHDVESFKSDSTGELFIKRMPESVTTSNHIRAYLKELEQAHGFRPDVLVVDYLDLMATNNKSISIENMFIADKFKAEELRAIGLEYDCHIATASQLGRCVEVNSLVILDSGKEIKIKDVKIGDKIKTNTGFNEVLAKTEIKKQKVYQIKTKTGKILKMSAQHTLPIFDREGKIIEELNINSGLKIGDLIYVSKSN